MLAPPTYQSVTAGPTAKLIFSSPQLFNQYGTTILDLYIYDHEDECSFTTKGRVSLSPEEQRKSVLIPANQRQYMRVAYVHGWLSSTRKIKKDFSFVPKENYEYTVEHIDNPARLKVNFYESNGTAPKRALDVRTVTCHGVES